MTLFAHSPDRFVLLLLAVGLGVGCQGLAPPENVIYSPAPVAGAAPVYVEPSPLFAPPGYTLGGVPAFPEPLASPAPPAFAAPVDGSGGAIAPMFGGPVAEAISPGLPNPLAVPVNNHDYAWDQIVDVVSDYFPIASEQRVQVAGAMWTEGRIETPYQSGATVFEPQKRDTIGSFNRWQSTLQTIRRRAVLRITPAGQGYAVEVRVDKELEDLPKPERASAGAATLRNDNALPAVGREAVSRERSSLVWIPLGRDTPLEQQMLADIQARLVAAPPAPLSITPVP